MKILHILGLASLLWLAGCASTTNPSNTTNTPTGDSHTSQAPQYPAGPLRPIMAGAARGHAVAGINAPSDLWDRIRRGFAMPALETEQVRDREQWYAARPDYMQRMTERSSKYLFHIVEELERRGMPTELALLPYIESAFNPQAVSSAKAAGMWQFMPATGTYFDLKQNVFRDDRRDVLASTRAALDYLQSCTACLATGSWRWPPTTGARAASRAPLRAMKNRGWAPATPS